VARVSVKLPAGVTYPDPQKVMECEGATVGEVLQAAIAQEPRFKSRIFLDDGRLWVGIFLNGVNMRQHDGLDTRVADGDKIMIVPPIAGG
jgi:molybdopterin synthase sulfur carrier subunit